MAVSKWIWVKIKAQGIGPQVLVHVTTYRVQSWVPIIDPQPNQAVQREPKIKPSSSHKEGTRRRAHSAPFRRAKASPVAGPFAVLLVRFVDGSFSLGLIWLLSLRRAWLDLIPPCLLSLILRFNQQKSTFRRSEFTAASLFVSPPRGTPEKS